MTETESARSSTAPPAPATDTPPSGGAALSEPKKRQRDPRIDFWRGIAMAIIFMAHMPGNWWNRFIPAKYGPSDATEMFVFCSGFASAVAFGGVFMRRGLWMGAARIIHRCWQIYWAHIGLFLALLVVCYLGTQWGDGTNYINKLNLRPFVKNPDLGLAHLMTFTYVPNYFDILPMYFVVLLMVPIVMALHKWAGFPAAAAFVILVWLTSNVFEIDPPAEWWSDRAWFFNPLGWCLIFFTGFAVSMGWIKAPPPNRFAIIGCIIFVIALIPISRWQIYSDYEELKVLRRETLAWAFQKTDFGIVRFLHFLALAYVAHCAFLTRQHWLRVKWLKPVMMLGQNALPVFLVSMVLSWTGGIILDVTGRDYLTIALANITGLALLVGVAAISAFYKRKPWEQKKHATPPPDSRSQGPSSQSVLKPAIAPGD